MLVKAQLSNYDTNVSAKPRTCIIFCTVHKCTIPTSWEPPGLQAATFLPPAFIRLFVGITKKDKLK